MILITLLRFTIIPVMYRNKYLLFENTLIKL